MDYSISSRAASLAPSLTLAISAKAKELRARGEDVIGLGAGEPDFDTPQHIKDAAAQALADGFTKYTPSSGIPELRQAVTADIGLRRGVEVDPANVLIVPGGKVTMFFAMLMFGEAGAEILYPNPGFPIYQSAIEFTGATAVAMPLHEDTGFSFKADEVLDLISPNTRLIILNSPANPTGGVTPREEIERLVNGLSAHPDVYIMSDEIYARMLYDGREHVSLLEFEAIRDRVILLDGWSKTYAMTGWRMGYGVWPKTLIEGATRLAINCHSCVNAASQFAGIAALEGPQSDVDDMVQAFDRRRGIIVEALNQIPGITCAGSGGAFYAFANTSGTGIGSMALQDKFLNEAGVATLSGTSFGHMGEGYLRFSYANSVDNIKTAIQRIRECL